MMPDIKFFVPAQINNDCTWTKPVTTKSVRLGDWEFALTKMEAIDGPVNKSGKWDFLGYELTYTNPDISQEERDRLWQQYLEETGQSGK